MVRRVRGARLAALLVTLVAPVFLMGSSAMPTSDFVQVAEEIAPHVHLLHLRAIYFIDPTGNVEVIEQSDGLVLIDSGGYFGAGERVVKMVKAISPKPVKAIVLSHYHSDHSFGVPAILAAWPNAQFIASEGTYQAMAEGRPPGAPRQLSKDFEDQRMRKLRVSFAARAKEVATIKDPRQRIGWERELATLDQRVADVPGTYTILPRRTFKDRLDLPDRTTPVELLFLGRANTPGDTLAWLPRERILITGDIVIAPDPYMIDVYPTEMLAVFKRMRAIPFRLMIPGHGAPQSRSHFDSYIDRLETMVRDVQRRVAPLARQKLTVEQIQARVDGSRWRRAFAGSDSWLGFWFDNYSWNPLVESVVHEARGEPLGPPPVTS